jgi:hypothetical protein
MISGRFLAGVVTPLLVVVFMPVASVAQGRPSEASATKWEQPRTQWGDPDLQGIWNNTTATPLVRPNGQEKVVLTADEAAEYERRAAEQRAAAENRPHTGYSQRVWFETSHDLSGNRLSLLVDPADGKLPALTPAAQAMVEKQTSARKTNPADGPEDRGPYERCITRGLPGAMFPGFYNHNYQIFQTPGYVLIYVEMIHDVRIIPVDRRPHVGTGIKQWLGDSRGRWGGNTLIVETTNLRDIDQNSVVGLEPRGDDPPGSGALPAFGTRSLTVFGTSERGRVIERFTRLGPDVIDYQVTVDDPAWYTRPWTASIPMSKVKGPLYEYACHEGNYGLPNILAGHRREEREAAQKR